jgi:hypothetical protein
MTSICWDGLSGGYIATNCDYLELNRCDDCIWCVGCSERALPEGNAELSRFELRLPGLDVGITQ